MIEPPPADPTEGSDVQFRGLVLVLAEGVGFEPTRSKLLAVFKTAAIGH